MSRDYLRLAVPISVAALCASCAVFVAYDSPLTMMVAPDPPHQMLMAGRTALFAIAAVGSALLLAYAVHTDTAKISLLVAVVLVLAITLGGTFGTVRIQNYLQAPNCCDLYISEWGYPYGWISCVGEAFCGWRARAEYYWLALVANVLFWANAAVCAVGLLGFLPRWLRAPPATVE